MGNMKRCKDCVAEGVTTRRKLATKPDGTLQPGPRCVTHHRLKIKNSRQARWELDLMLNYGLTPKQYWAIYKEQDGCCYICWRAQGISRRLCVDHDHRTGKVRGLLCRHCNRDVLGFLREDVGAFERAVKYLRYPPADRLGVDVIVPEHEDAA